MFDLRAWQLPAVRRTWRRSWSSWRSLRRSRMINRFMHANCQCLMRRTDDVTRLRDVAVKCCYIVRMYNVHEVYLANGLVQQITVKPVSTITPPSLNRKRPKDVFSSIGDGRGGWGGVCGEGRVSKPLLIITYLPSCWRISACVICGVCVSAQNASEPLEQLLSCFW